MKKNIKDLLGNFKEEPSARCWESIEQHLNGLHSTSSSTENGTSTSSGTKNPFVQKSAAFWGKAIVVTVSTAAIVAVAVITVVNVLKNNQNTIKSVKPDKDTVSVTVKDTLFLEKETSSILFEQPLWDDSKSDFTNENDIIYNTVDSTFENVSCINSTNTSLLKSVSTDSAITPKSVVQVNYQPSSVHQYDNKVDEKSADDLKKAANHFSSKNQAPSVPSRHDQHMEHSFEQPEEVSVVENKKEIFIRIPNIFTPNGDGINDYFEIEDIENFENVALIIRNRNGNVIFSSKRYENNWDGGQWEDGIYFYFVTYTVDGIDYVKNGTVTIKRNL